jgi:hypothetical protein
MQTLVLRNYFTNCKKYFRPHCLKAIRYLFLQNILLAFVCLMGQITLAVEHPTESDLDTDPFKNNADQWALTKEKKRIKLYSRPKKDSNLIEIKVTTTLNVPLEKALKLFSNGDGCDSWQSLCRSSKIIPAEPEGENLIYMVLNLPWPLADRDIVIIFTHKFDSEKKLTTVYFQPATDSYPQQDILRGELKGYYTLQSISPKEIELTWVAFTDFRIDLSPNIVNARFISTTLKDIEQLVNLAED